jgi:hypothetical protein
MAEETYYSIESAYYSLYFSDPYFLDPYFSDPYFSDPYSSESYYYSSESPYYSSEMSSYSNESMVSGGSCIYSKFYTEGSAIRGRVFIDKVSLGRASNRAEARTALMGCHTQETGLFKNQLPNGIMGLWREGWDIVEALADEHLEREVFTFCFAEDGGEMTLGALDTARATEPLRFVSYTGVYDVPIREISVDGEVVFTGLANAVIETGTTFTYLKPKQARILRSTVGRVCRDSTCGSLIGQCWHSADLAAFPTFHFTLGSVMVAWGPHKYLHFVPAKSPDDLGRWCWSFFGDPGKPTLGASFLQNLLVTFDRASSRVGFANATCPSYTLGDREGIPAAGSSHSAGNSKPIPNDLAPMAEAESAPSISTSTATPYHEDTPMTEAESAPSTATSTTTHYYEDAPGRRPDEDVPVTITMEDLSYAYPAVAVLLFLRWL